jgi:hypothetical protein
MEDGNNKLQKASELFQSSIDRYSSNLELRNAICQIHPEIGPAIDFMIIYLANKFQGQRMADSILIVHEEVELLSETKIDKEFLKREEFFDLFTKTLDNCIRTRHRERIRLNCKILVGAISLDNIRDRHSAEDFLSLVVDLTPADIMLGFKIYEQQKNKPTHFDFESQDNNELKFVVSSGWHKLEELCNLERTQFDIALHKLSSAGLIKEIVGMYVNYTGGLYVKTPAFQSLMNFIRLNANDPLFNIRIRDT